MRGLNKGYVSFSDLKKLSLLLIFIFCIMCQFLFSVYILNKSNKSYLIYDIRTTKKLNSNYDNLDCLSFKLDDLIIIDYY